jgi:hypothetical protein
MVKLTPLKIRRMSLGLRQVDVVIATGIPSSRYSAIENELTPSRSAEREAIELFLAQRRSNGQLKRVGAAKSLNADGGAALTGRADQEAPGRCLRSAKL